MFVLFRLNNALVTEIGILLNWLSKAQYRMYTTVWYTIGKLNSLYIKIIMDNKCCHLESQADVVVVVLRLATSGHRGHLYWQEVPIYWKHEHLWLLYSGCGWMTGW